MSKVRVPYKHVAPLVPGLHSHRNAADEDNKTTTQQQAELPEMLRNRISYYYYCKKCKSLSIVEG